MDLLAMDVHVAITARQTSVANIDQMSNSVADYQAFLRSYQEEESRVNNAIVIFGQLKAPGYILSYYRTQLKNPTTPEVFYFACYNPDGSVTSYQIADLSNFAVCSTLNGRYARMATNVIHEVLHAMIQFLFRREQEGILHIFEGAISEVVLANVDIHNRVQGSDFFHACWGGIVDTLKECYLSGAVVTPISLHTTSMRKMKAAINLLRVSHVNPAICAVTQGITVQLATLVKQGQGRLRREQLTHAATQETLARTEEALEAANLQVTGQYIASQQISSAVYTASQGAVGPGAIPDPSAPAHAQQIPFNSGVDRAFRRRRIGEIST